MDTPEYGHLLLAPIYLVMGLRFYFSRKLEKREPRWPFPFTNHPMSRLSRGIVLAFLFLAAAWEAFRGVFHLKPNLIVIGFGFLSLGALFAAYCRDRQDETRRAA